MTDAALRDLIAKHDSTRDLVLKHDATIIQLVANIEHLVTVQSELSKDNKETNKRLEEISKFLAKQAVFGSKLDGMDKELTDSFKRVHKRVDELDAIQKSEKGCPSVQLLTKDVNNTSKDVMKLTGDTEEHRIRIENVEQTQGKMVSPSTIKGAIAILITYSVMFGTYVVTSIHENRMEMAKTEMILDARTKELDRLSTLVEKVIEKDKE